MSANYAPTYTYYGDLQVNSAGSNNNSVARRADVSGLSFISSIAADSQNLLTVTNGALSVQSLLVTDVTVDTTYTSLSAYVSAGIPASMKKGDVLVLSAANPSESYMCKVESPSAASDFARLNEFQEYTAGDGLDLTGSVFSVDLANNGGLEFASGELKAKLDSTGGLQALAGGLSLLLDGGTLTKSASGLKVGQIANAEISNSAAIAQSKLDLAITNTEVAAGAAIAQSKLALAITNSEVDASAAIAQSKLALAITNSEVDASAAIAQSKLALAITNSEVDASAAIAQSKLALAITNSEVAAGAAIAQSKLALVTGTDTQDDIPVMGPNVASTNDFLQVEADGRLRGRDRAGVMGQLSGQASADFSMNSQKITGLADPVNAQEAATKAYVDSLLTSIRYEATNQTLSANTAFTVTHNLGKKVVQVSVMDRSNNKKIDVEVTYTNTNSLSILSNTGLGVDIAVSI